MSSIRYARTPRLQSQTTAGPAAGLAAEPATQRLCAVSRLSLDPVSHYRVYATPWPRTRSEVRQIIALSRSGLAPCEEVRAFIRARLAEIERTLGDLQALRQRLTGTLRRWEGSASRQGPAHVCGLIEATLLDAPDTAAKRK